MIITDNSPLSSGHHAIVRASDSNLSQQECLVVSSVRKIRESAIPGAVEPAGFLAASKAQLSFDGQAVSGAVLVKYAGSADQQTAVDSYPAILNQQARTGASYEQMLGNSIYDPVGPTAVQSVYTSGLSLHATAIPAVKTAVSASDVQLLVNPSTGNVTLISAVSNPQAVITAYSISSASGSLTPFPGGGSHFKGTSFENNPNVYYTSASNGTFNNWAPIKNTTTVISEGFNATYTATDDTTWTNYSIPAGGYAFGAMFNSMATGGAQDVAFRWDDQNLNVYTGTVTYVPEPASVGLLAAGAIALLGRRRRGIENARV